MVKIKGLLGKAKERILAHPIEFGLIVVFYAVLLVVFLISIKELGDRFHYELSNIASCDANLFFTVGKAMGEGYRPYLDYYENKPPMIFLLCEVSYRLTGGFHLVNVDSFLCCLNLLLCTFLIGPIIGWRRGYKALPIAVVTCLIGSAGILFMTYAEAKSGEIMTEIFGVSAIMDMVLCLLLLPKGKKIAFYDPRIILAGFFFGVATMFKEPFAILGAIALLFFLERKEDLLTKFVFPCVYGVVTAFFILLISRAIPGYFSIYLPNMLGHHIETYGSIWDRMNNVDRLFDNLRSYCWELRALVLAFLVVSMLRGLFMEFSQKPLLNIPLKLIRTLLPILYLYAASFCVGLGGQYYWHHFAFALPFYYLMLIDATAFLGDQANSMNFLPISKENMGEILKSYAKPLTLLSLAFSLSFSIVSGHGLATHDYTMKEEKMIAFVEQAERDAKYVDEVLDKLNQDTYLYVGFNGDSRLYCYTTHLPMGPSFVQDPNNFYSEDTFFAKEFLIDLEVASVLVVRSFKHGVLTDYVKQYVASNFTRKAPADIAPLEVPEGFGYALYYRTGVFQ